MFDDWRIDEHSDSPIYEQIADYFRKTIKNGHFVHGDVLPSQRDLCRLFQVSRPTISKALEMLEYDKLIKIELRKKAVVQVCQDNCDHAPIKWDEYTRVASHVETSEIYKFINYIRSDVNITNLFESYFGHDFAPYKPMEQAIESARKNIHSIDHHSNFDIRGILPLRQTICNHLAKEEIYASPSQVVVFDNIQTAYYSIFQVICGHSVNCYVEEESVFLLDKILPACVNFVPVQTDSKGVVPDALLKKLRTRRKGVLLVEPHFSMPACATYPIQRKKELLNIASEWSLPIVECETIRDCWHREKPVISLKAMDVNQNVIHIFSLARPFMIAPMAAIIAPEFLVPTLLNVKLKNSVYSDIFSQMIMEKLLSENIYSDYMDSVRESIIERCDEVDVLLHKYFDDLASWTKPTYGVTYRLNFNQSVTECINTLRKEGLLLFPPSFFGSGKNFIWFCYTGVSVEKLEHALSRISFHMRRTGKH